MNLRILIGGMAALSALYSCSSTDKKLEKFYGKPIQYIMLERGEPNQIINMPHNGKAFQWDQKPDNVASNVIGDRLIGVDMSDECRYTVFTEWDELQDAYIIYDHEEVKFGC